MKGETMNNSDETIRIRLSGLLGKALAHSCANRLKTIDYRQMVEPFRDRSERDNAWRCEFWGKVVRSAILTNRFRQDPVLGEKIETTVGEMMAKD